MFPPTGGGGVILSDCPSVWLLTKFAWCYLFFSFDGAISGKLPQIC